jgi:hypothetical protein
MLDDDQRRRQAARRARDARRRERLRGGKGVAPLEYDGALLDLLIRLGYLTKRDAVDLGLVPRACLRRLLGDGQAHLVQARDFGRVTIKPRPQKHFDWRRLVFGRDCRWRMGDREGRDLGYLWFTWVTHWTPPIYAQVHPK